MTVFGQSEVNPLQGLLAFPADVRRRNRSFCHLSLIFLLLLAPLAHSIESTTSAREYRLRFCHTHTGVRLDVVYRRGDHYIPEALEELDRYL